MFQFCLIFIWLLRKTMTLRLGFVNRQISMGMHLISWARKL